MLQQQKYRAAAIGWTGHGDYGHGLHVAYQGIENVEFVAIADPDERGRSRAQQQTGAARVYEDYQQMLAEEAPDIVSVCPRWTDCHEELVIACIEAGCHVYCEKPIAPSLAEADRMVEAAAAAGRKIAFAHQGVYLPSVQRIRDLLRSGEIGEVLALHARGKEDHRGGGEDMLVLGTHLFNMMRFFAGDVISMFAHVTVRGRPITPADVTQAREPVGPVAGDCVISQFHFANGAVGSFESRRGQPNSRLRFGIEIMGTEGRLHLRSGTADATAIYRSPVLDPWDSGLTWEILDWGDEEISIPAGNRRAILDLIEAIEEDRDPLSSGADARAALEMILGAYESQITGQRVELPLLHREHPLTRWLEVTYA